MSVEEKNKAMNANLLNDRIHKFIGLAARAGKVVSGNDQVISELYRNNTKLILLAKDASSNTVDKFLKVCKDYLDKGDSKEIVIYSFSSMFELGNAIGKPSRAIVAITDEGFVGKLVQMLDQVQEMEGET